MKELTKGKITLEELADWFGIAYSTIRKAHHKARKLELLSNFAKYHFEGKSIIIDEVYEPIYSKAYDVVKEKFPDTWHKNGIDTCARVGSEIYWQNELVKSQIQEQTAQNYANIIKVEMYGHNHLNDRGTKGRSEYCWCRMVGREAFPLSDKELAIIQECSQLVYGEKVSGKIALLNDALQKKEITEAEFQQSVILNEEERAECYVAFVELVERRLGFYPDKATYLTDETGAW